MVLTSSQTRFHESILAKTLSWMDRSREGELPNGRTLRVREYMVSERDST